MLGFDALASLPLASIPSVSGNVTLDGVAGSLVFTGQDATGTVGYITDGVAGSLLFTGQDATGTISGGDTDTHDSFWYREWQKRHKKRKPPTIEVMAEAVAENIEEAISRPEVLAVLPEVDYEQVQRDIQLQRFIAEQILMAMKRKAEFDRDYEIRAMLLL